MTRRTRRGCHPISLKRSVCSIFAHNYLISRRVLMIIKLLSNKTRMILLWLKKSPLKSTIKSAASRQWIAKIITMGRLVLNKATTRLRVIPRTLELQLQLLAKSFQKIWLPPVNCSTRPIQTSYNKYYKLWMDHRLVDYKIAVKSFIKIVNKML